VNMAVNKIEECVEENSTYSKNMVVMRRLVSHNMHKKY